jgi:hypothetical protein
MKKHWNEKDFIETARGEFSVKGYCAKCSGDMQRLSDGVLRHYNSHLNVKRSVVLTKLTPSLVTTTTLPQHAVTSPWKVSDELLRLREINAELLEACKAVYNSIRDDGGTDLSVGIIRQLTDAISKAEQTSALDLPPLDLGKPKRGHDKPVQLE